MDNLFWDGQQMKLRNCSLRVCIISMSGSFTFEKVKRQCLHTNLRTFYVSLEAIIQQCLLSWQITLRSIARGLSLSIHQQADTEGCHDDQIWLVGWECMVDTLPICPVLSPISIFPPRQKAVPSVYWFAQMWTSALAKPVPPRTMSSGLSLTVDLLQP